jgi:hypothetical protein
MQFGSTEISGLSVGNAEASKAYLGVNEVWSSGFDPLSLSPILWLDGSDTSTMFDAVSGGSLVVADGTVARWQDKSGNNNHATRSGAGSRPARRVAAENGLDAIDFASSKYFDLTAATPNSSAHSEFFVFRRSASGSSNPILTKAGVFNHMAPYWFSDNNIYYWFEGTAAIASGGTGSGLQLMGATRNGGAYEIRKNGVSLASGASGLGTVAANYSLIGSRALSEYHNNKICEILVFNYQLNNGEVELVEAYLSSKWGIA